MTPIQKRVAFNTLGCKLNFSETSTISRTFEKKGFEIVDFEDEADVYVINTCSVTDHADRKCKKIVRDALKINPEAKIAVMGCYAQLKPKEISEIPGVKIVVGANEKFNLVNHLENLTTTGESLILNSHIKEVERFENAYSLGDRTRSFLKVQDGCNYFCSFCTIPLARGRSRSDYIENIVHSAYEIAENGVKEIVITGVNTGDFSNDRKETFFDLVKALDKVSDIARFRISSIEPNLLSDEIIRFLAGSQRFVPHFHVPLQSGSDNILKAMRRRYKKDLYASRVALMKKLMPHCCIGVDVIVGFPGETDEDFEETYSFLHELNISYLHVFTYSERPNTTAVRLKDKIPNNIRTQRRKRLQSLSHKKRMYFYSQHLGNEAEVLFEGENKEGWIHGFTKNYIRVKVPYDAGLVNTMQPLILEEIDSDGVVRGEIRIVETIKS